MSSSNPILTCREVIALLGDDLDGSLPLTTELRLKLHLFLCRQCRQFRRTYRRTVSTVRRLRTLENGFEAVELPEELVSRILAQRKM